MVGVFFLNYVVKLLSFYCGFFIVILLSVRELSWVFFAGMSIMYVLRLLSVFL